MGQLVEDQLDDNEARGPYALLQGASGVVRLRGETLRKRLVSVGLVESLGPSSALPVG